MSVEVASDLPGARPARGGNQQPRVALVHDFLLDLRGAERVFAALCDMWPEADVFTAVYDERGTEGRFAHRDVNTSFLQRLRPTARTFRPLLPLYPLRDRGASTSPATTSSISSSSAWAHGVHRRRATPSTSATATTRSATRGTRARRRSPPRGRSRARRCGVIFKRWRQWDCIAAQRVDRYVANSRDDARAASRATSAATPTVLHPPVETGPLRAAGRSATTTWCSPS